MADEETDVEEMSEEDLQDEVERLRERVESLEEDNEIKDTLIQGLRADKAELIGLCNSLKNKVDTLSADVNAYISTVNERITDATDS